MIKTIKHKESGLTIRVRETLIEYHNGLEMYKIKGHIKNNNNSFIAVELCINEIEMKYFEITYKEFN